MDKHPIGIMPRKIWDEKCKEERLKELLAAMNRYSDAGFEIPNKWHAEYLDLIVDDEKTTVEQQLFEDNERLRFELKALQKRYKTVVKESAAKSRKITELKKTQDKDKQHYRNGKRGQEGKKGRRF